MAQHAERHRFRGTLGLVVLLAGLWLPASASADMPMFFVASFLRFASIPALVVVLLIEAAAIRWAFGFDWRRSLLTSVIANAASAAIGALAYPSVGMVIYPVLAPIVVGLMDATVSHEILFTLLLVALLDTVIELPVIGKVRSVRISFRSTVIFLLANLIGSIVLALAIVDWSEIQRERIPEEEIARLEAYYAEEIDFIDEIFAQVPDAFDRNGHLIEEGWHERFQDRALGMRFGMLGVTSRYIYYIVRPRNLHSQSGLRGKGYFRREELTVWRTVDQNGVWYYSYRLKSGIGPNSPGVAAIFERPP